ncbi:MAG: sigma-E processing peptidase SpoIIGA [Lachnotalea sp.]
MYYELYVDVLFLINMCMDFYILAIIKKIMGCTATYLRIFLISAISSMLTTIIIVLPLKSIIIKYIIIHLGINVISAKTALKIKGKVNVVKAVILLYIMTFIFGGVLNWVAYGVKINVEELLLAGLLLFILIRGAIIIYTFYKRKSGKTCEVIIILNCRQLKLKGLVDTGNSLVEPISKKPVNIVPLDVIQEVLSQKQINYIKTFLEYGMESIDTDWDELSGICYVPYCSVGKKNGLLPAIRVEKMIIIQGEKINEINKPIIGICQNDFVSDKRYHIILNPKLVD